MEPPSKRTIDVLNRSQSDVDTEPLERAALAALECHGLSGEVCIVLTTDEEVQSLNSAHRQIHKPTDVLTFPASAQAREFGQLGDVVIAVPFAARQAARRGVPLDVELAYLAMHGALHLAGFEDETPDDKEAMQAEMARLARQIGLPADPDWASIGHESPAEAMR